MKSYLNYLKNILKSIIKEMSNSTENFVKNPLKDFTRTRKIGFEEIITFLLGMNGSSLSKELLEYFDFDKNTLWTYVSILDTKNRILLGYIFR